MLVTVGCSTQSRAPVDDASACAADLTGVSRHTGQELDAHDFSVVNWNIQKGQDPDWAGDLTRLATEPDLLILQEASPLHDAWSTLAPHHYHSFARGYGSERSASGVMTVSSVLPLSECDLVSREPWLGTRKATLVTEYGLTGTNQTLLVVNIHGINFTFGVRDLRAQFEQVRSVIANHRGPVLFSGDFNTWRDARTRMLEDVIAGLGLTQLAFATDHRKRFFGRPLDHIYVRGLDTTHATTRDLDSSDHNPMSVRLALTPEREEVDVP